jgi:hypothetical protein
MSRRAVRCTEAKKPATVRPSLAEGASHEAYAAAMVACQGYAPACSDQNECLHDGLCFSSSGRGFAGARKLIKTLVNLESDVSTRAWLRLALDALDHHKFITRGAIDALRVVAINRSVREQYGPIITKDD